MLLTTKWFALVVWKRMISFGIMLINTRVTCYYFWFYRLVLSLCLLWIVISKMYLITWHTTIAAFTPTEVSLEDKEDESINVENQAKECTMPKNNSTRRILPRGSCFWTEGWRAALCTCESCKEVLVSYRFDKLLVPVGCKLNEILRS